MTPALLVPTLKAIVDEAIAQGFRVFVPTRAAHAGEPIGTARLCLDIEGSFAQVGTWRLFGYEPLLSAPVEPRRAYDFAGMEALESDDSLQGRISALTTACLSDTVTLRYFNVDVPNYGKKCLLPDADAPEGFVELAADCVRPVEA